MRTEVATPTPPGGRPPGVATHTAPTAPRGGVVRLRRRRWPFVVLVCVAVIALVLVFAQDDKIVRLKSPVAVGDARYPDYVASLVGAPVTIGDSYTVLENGDEIFPAMLHAVRGAQRRISFESFIFEPGKMGAQFLEAFVEAARRGVAVRLVLDAFGSMNLTAADVERLQAAGARVVWFNPFRPWTLDETNYRTHRKVLVIDGSVAFTGGVGVADHWQGNAQDEDHWRDTQFRVTGPAVRALEASFYENWLEAGGEEAPALDPEDPPLGTGARSIVVWSNPSSGVTNVKLLYLLSIAAARRTIDIQSPYVILDPSTRFALDDARRRGVRVRLLTESDTTDARPVKEASRAAYEGLLESGFEIYEFLPTMMHVKVMVVDGSWSVVGSANFDNRSFELNDELTIAVADERLAATLVEHFERDLARARRLTLAEWRTRSSVQKAKEQFWALWGEFF